MSLAPNQTAGAAAADAAGARSGESATATQAAAAANHPTAGPAPDEAAPGSAPTPGRGPTSAPARAADPAASHKEAQEPAPALTPLPRVDTPAVLVDLVVAGRNLVRGQALISGAGLRARPHIKTHKIPDFALWQLSLGAIGITCQKVSEAEVFAAAGCTDILIPYNIVGAAKLARLRALAGTVRLSTSADGPEVVAGLSAAFATAPQPLAVLVECDTGQHRCGQRSPEGAAALAAQIAASPGLSFAGLLTYPARGQRAEVSAWLAAARDACTARGLPPGIISSGGTPDLDGLEADGVTTEYRAGTYIYNDRSLVLRGARSYADCALRVATTVVSRPEPGLAILDAGSKVLTSDLMGLTGFGYCPEYPGAHLRSLNEEHGYLVLDPADGPGPEVGAQLSIIPNHACTVSNMVDEILPHRAGELLAPLLVAARGKLR